MSNCTSTLTVGITSKAMTYSYAYDADSNITQIMDGNGKTTSYIYDDLGLLLRENNQVLGKTYVYTYDKAGNRKSKKTYAYTTATSLSSLTYTEETYTYGNAWGDQLTAVNSTTIAYDATGNPTTYNGYDLTWHGRQLKKMIRNGGQAVISFAYNADGIRTNKIVDGVKHVYTLNGTQIVSEAWGINLLIYLYDESGSPIGLQYRTSSYYSAIFDTFYFEKNLQGDIVAVYNADGDKIGSYTYDAWGNFTVSVDSSNSTLENKIVRTLNPFHYRGYYYDTETQLYYLQSRYYNPAWGRFLNKDGYVNANGDLIGFNMYAYCSNNPVMGYDPSGYADEDIKDDDIGHIKDPAPVHNGTGNMGYKGGSGTGGASGSSQNMCGKVYRGGAYTARSCDVRIDKSTGMMKPGWGISVNTDPSKVSSFGEVSRVDTIPNGLTIVPTGGPGHYEIVPINPMTLIQYQELLSYIEYTILR